jgi:hypothetical protein
MINLTKKFVVMSIAMSVLLAMSTTSSAARIYNGTTAVVQVNPTLANFDISAAEIIGEANVSASFDTGITLNPGTRSDSLSWGSSSGVLVRDREDNTMCFVRYDFGHFEMVGGNYLLISQDKETITCNLCTATKHAAPKKSGHGLVKDGSGANLTAVSGQKNCT